MFRLRYLESIVGRCGHANLRIKLAVCSAIAICYAIHLYSLHMQLALYIYGGYKIAAAYVVSIESFYYELRGLFSISNIEILTLKHNYRVKTAATEY